MQTTEITYICSNPPKNNSYLNYCDIKINNKNLIDFKYKITIIDEGLQIKNIINEYDLSIEIFKNKYMNLYFNSQNNDFFQFNKNDITIHIPFEKCDKILQILQDTINGFLIILNFEPDK